MSVTIEPDPEPRRSPWHKKIVSAVPIANTRSGNTVTLECGHVVQLFGNIAYAEGRAMCQKCRDKASVIICAPADVPMTIEGSTFDQRCGICHKPLMLSPAGQRLLEERPALVPLCEECGSPVLASDPDARVMFTAESYEEFLQEQAKQKANPLSRKN